GVSCVAAIDPSVQPPGVPRTAGRFGQHARRRIRQGNPRRRPHLKRARSAVPLHSSLFTLHSWSMRIGLLSDTHQPSDRRTLWEEIHIAFAGVDLILHAGDIVHPMVLDWLDEIAPTLAARGNNDWGIVDPRIEETQILEFHGV